MGVFLGLEIVCWDILGKDCGCFVYVFLGGKMNECLCVYIYFYLLFEYDINVFWILFVMYVEVVVDFLV